MTALFILIIIDNNKYKCVAYSLCAYEYEDKDKEYVSVSDLVLLALISCDESYEILKHDFDDLHKAIEFKISSNQINCDNFNIRFQLIICSDMKSLFTFLGLSGVCSKFNCIYCSINKNQISDVNNFFANQLWKSRLEGGLGRVESDWNDIKRDRIGIKNDMLVKISPNSVVIDTLHLRIRILEKFVSSVISSIINFELNDKFVELMNEELKRNNICANIYSDVKSEFCIKYKINCLNLNVRITVTKIIVNYIKNNYNNFDAIELIGKIWDNWLIIFSLIESASTQVDAYLLENSIKENYSLYNEIFKLNVIEFGNKRFTPYMHVLCHLPNIIRIYGKVSIFNTQGLIHFSSYI